MKPEEYKTFENDTAMQTNFQEQLYEILNMSNDMLQAFYYAENSKYRTKIDTEIKEDERPNTKLLVPNKNYLNEISRYVRDEWDLPENNGINASMLKVLHSMTSGKDKKHVTELQENINL